MSSCICHSSNQEISRKVQERREGDTSNHPQSPQHPAPSSPSPLPSCNDWGTSPEYWRPRPCGTASLAPHPSRTLPSHLVELEKSLGIPQYLACGYFHDYYRYMESTVTTKNMVSIPQALSRLFGIKPGWKLDWKPGNSPDEIIVTVIPDRAERGRRLMGQGAYLTPGQDAVATLTAEREAELEAERAAEYETGGKTEPGAES